MEITRDYTFRLLQCAYNVHNELGPGLLENVYKKALKYELELNGFNVKEEITVPILYKGKLLDDHLRLDLMVDDRDILELKSVEEVKKVFYKQLLTYLKLSKCKLGYLINFNVEHLRDGITRVANNF